MTDATPRSLAMVSTLAGVTLRRLVRGKALWIGVVIAALPLCYAVSFHFGKLRATSSKVFDLALMLLAIVPAMFVGSAVGDEIEQRTSAYLWSRPLARWVVLAGKLYALVPVVVVLIVGGWAAAAAIGLGTPPAPDAVLALLAACLASAFAAAGMTTLVPNHGMAMTIAYMLVDLFIGALPFSLQQLSITHQARIIAGFDRVPQAYAAPLIALAVIAAVWGAIGLWRIRRLEV